MISMNKYLSKKFFEKNKIKTPKYFYFEKKNDLDKDIRKKIKKNKLNFPIVIKPNNEGSSIGVKICKNFPSLIREYKKLKKLYGNFLFETYIPGQEIQVAIMGGKSIGAIELRPKRKFYDYKAKYKKSAKTMHIVPAPINKKNIKKFVEFLKKPTKYLNAKV